VISLERLLQARSYRARRIADLLALVDNRRMTAADLRGMLEPRPPSQPSRDHLREKILGTIYQHRPTVAYANIL